MKYTLSLILSLLLWQANAADTLQIMDAIAKRRITVEALGSGGLGAASAQLMIQNNISAALNIAIPAGLLLSSVDPDAQDLLLLEDAILYVSGRKNASLELYGACTQSGNYAPKQGESYTLGASVRSELLAIANIINENELQASLGQAAVWAFTDQHDLDNIFAENYVEQSWDIAKIIAIYRKENPPTREEVQSWQRASPRIVFSSRTDLKYHAPTDARAELAIYDTTGALIRRQFELKPLHAGLHLYTVGLNNILEQDTQYIVRLKDEHGTILAESSLNNNQPYHEITKKILKIDFEYIVRQSSKVTMAIYDDQNEVVQYIFENRSMALSKRRSNFKFFHAFITGTNLMVKITDDQGSILHEEALVAN